MVGAFDAVLRSIRLIMRNFPKSWMDNKGDIDAKLRTRLVFPC